MCGTRIERRVKERRGSGIQAQVAAGESQGRAVAQANAQLPSPDLGAASPDWPRTRAAASTPAVLNQMERAQPPAAVHREQRSSTIGGPSFLGLSSDPQGDGEYLLEDESSGSGLRRLVLLVVLLAIAGLIFVQWRASYHANPKSLEPPKPQPATVPRPQGMNGPSPANAKTTENAKNGTPAGSDAKTDPEAKTKDDATGIQPGTPAGTKDARPSDGETKIATAAEGVAAQSGKEERQVALTSRHTKAKADDEVQDSSANEEASDQGQKGSDQKRSGGSAGREKPSIALVKAQRYLQGRGVRQNCEQGMMYLKAATQQNDPSAAVQMAALYASGHCVQQDRVKAYQWFSSAYSQEPDNQWIAKNMNQLWGQMTPQQRRQFQ
jgi:hypothetical protein